MQPQTKSRGFPRNSCFSAYKTGAADVIPGAGEAWCTFDTEEIDVLGEYDAATSLFTPSRNGIYLFTANVKLSGGLLGVQYFEIRLRNNAGVLYYVERKIKQNNGVYEYNIAGILQLTPALTIGISIRNPNANPMANNAATSTRFAGRRLM